MFPREAEDVIRPDGAARRAPAPQRGDRLHFTAQLDLSLQQPISRRPVLA